MQRTNTPELVKKRDEEKNKTVMMRHPRVDNQETTTSPTGEIGHCVDDQTSIEREKKRCHLCLVEPVQKEKPKPKKTIST